MQNDHEEITTQLHMQSNKRLQRKSRDGQEQTSKDIQPQDVQWRDTQRQTEYKDMQSHHRVMMRLKRARNKIKHAKQPQTTIRCRSMTS